MAELENTHGEDIFIIHLVRVKNSRMVASARTAGTNHITHRHLVCCGDSYFVRITWYNAGVCLVQRAVSMLKAGQASDSYRPREPCVFE